jgi:aromatic ring-opening dioxygenase catalytic subunit (LigB family)
MSFHNLGEFFSSSPDTGRMNGDFHDWLVTTCTDKGISAKETETRLIEWKKAPHARYCHPREEHLLPLHVCFGMASEDTPRGEEVFSGPVMGRRVTALLWR